MRATPLRRYHRGARFYDLLSLERPVYRPGRLLGLRALRLERGGRVLDIGCGTGLNLPSIRAAVGETGAVLGIDASAAMLTVARRRVAAGGWTNVRLRQADASAWFAASDENGFEGGVFDAVVFTYSLSIIAGWRTAFDQALARLRPGGRLVVVDMALPVGRWRVLAPLARLACWTGGADPHREPWRRVFDTMTDTSHQTIRGGHIHVAAGTRPPGEPEEGRPMADRS